MVDDHEVRGKQVFVLVLFHIVVLRTGAEVVQVLELGALTVGFVFVQQVVVAV